MQNNEMTRQMQVFDAINKQHIPVWVMINGEKCKITWFGLTGMGLMITAEVNGKEEDFIDRRENTYIIEGEE